MGWLEVRSSPMAQNEDNLLSAPVTPANYIFWVLGLTLLGEMAVHPSDKIKCQPTPSHSITEHANYFQKPPSDYLSAI